MSQPSHYPVYPGQRKRVSKPIDRSLDQEPSDIQSVREVEEDLTSNAKPTKEETESEQEGSFFAKYNNVLLIVFGLIIILLIVLIIWLITKEDNPDQLNPKSLMPQAGKPPDRAQYYPTAIQQYPANQQYHANQQYPANQQGQPVGQQYNNVQQTANQHGQQTVRFDTQRQVRHYNPAHPPQGLQANPQPAGQQGQQTVQAGGQPVGQVGGQPVGQVGGQQTGQQGYHAGQQAGQQARSATMSLGSYGNLQQPSAPPGPVDSVVLEVIEDTKPVTIMSKENIEEAERREIEIIRKTLGDTSREVGN